jgi:pimeloyl-ACP methyl ester carboxylesterase
VSEGAGLRSVRETFARQGVSALQVGLQAPSEAVLTAATALLSADAPPPSLKTLAAQVGPTPLFLIYGERGQAMEIALTPAYAKAAGPSARLWEVPGAGHTGGIDAQPADYERRVVAFFDRALLSP